MPRKIYTQTGVEGLIKAEIEARRKAALHLREAIAIHDQIQSKVQAADRELYSDLIYRGVRVGVSRYLAEMKRAKDRVNSALGNLETMRLPAYQSPEHLRDERREELERREARRARRSNA